MVSPAELSSNLSEVSLPTEHSPQSNVFTKFIPQQSHLLLQVYSCNHHPQRKRRTLFFNISPGSNFSAFVKDLFSQDENTFINISHVIPPIYIHDKVHTTRSHFENIMTSCISYIMTLLEMMFCLFRKKVNPKMITINYQNSRFDSCI